MNSSFSVRQVLRDPTVHVALHSTLLELESEPIFQTLSKAFSMSIQTANVCFFRLEAILNRLGYVGYLIFC